jgi:hypothetical protein
VASDEAKIMDARWDAKHAGGGNRFSRPKQDIQGHSGGIGIGRVAAAVIIEEINPGSLGALRYAACSTEDPQLDLVRDRGERGPTAHIFNGNTPIVKAPRLAHG